MAGTNNFVVFDSSGTNMMSDSSYQTNSSVLNGYTNGIADPTVDSKAMHQATIMSAALALLVAATGTNVSDADVNALAIALQSILTTASKNVSVTLAAASWSGSSAPYTQALAVTGLGSIQNAYVQVAQSATAAQRTAARYANLSVTAQAAGSITITADGTLPTVDIPLTVTLLG